MENVNDFYLTLPSNTPSFTSHQNRNTDFEVSLNRPVEFNGKEWEVGLTEVHLPNRKTILKFILYYAQLNDNTVHSLKPCTLKRLPWDNGKFSIGAYLEDGTVWGTFCPDTDCAADDYMSESFRLGIVEDLLKICENNQTITSEVVLPNFPTRTEQMVLDQMRNFTGPYTKQLKRLLTNRPVSSRLVYYIKFRNVFKNFKLPPGPGMGVFLLPEFNDRETADFWKKFGFTKNWQKRLVHVEESLCMPMYYYYPSFPDLVDVELNIIDYQKVGKVQKKLLRRVRRPTVEECNIQFKEVHYVPVNANRLTDIRVTLSTPNNLPAHVESKCQLVLHFRRRKSINRGALQ